MVNEVVKRGTVIGSPRTLRELSVRQEFISFYEHIRRLNVRLFVVSNQPDIARNLMDPQQLREITLALQKRFSFNEISYCTHDDDDQCSCRKPQPGLITSIINKYGLRKEDCVMIGDGAKDILAGNNAGIETVLLKRYHNKGLSCVPTYSVDSLDDVLSLNILRNSR